MSYIVDFEDVHKSFGTNLVLNGLNFHVQQGEILALLGHNGAGKTTTLRIILGLLEINSGHVKVFGSNPISKREWNRKQIGILSEDTGLYESLTVLDNLYFFADLYQCNTVEYKKRIADLLSMFQLYDKKDTRIKEFSSGMKKKVALIRTLFHNPKLVLMDEPVNALDPISIQLLHDEMNSMREKYGTTFIISTHNLDEVVKISDSIVIIKNGRSVREQSIHLDGSLNMLEAQFSLLNLSEGDKNKVKEILDGFHLGWNLKEEKLSVKNANDYMISELVLALSKNHIRICEIRKDQFNLESLYVQIEEENIDYEFDN